MLPSRPKSKSTIVHHISVLDKPRRSLSMTDHDECLLEYTKSLWNPEWTRNNLFCGELSKQSTSIYKGWQRRWLILTNEALFYFRRAPESIYDDIAPMGVLFLDSSVTVECCTVESAMSVYGLKISAPSSCSLESKKVYEKKSYVFLALSDADRQAWVQAIKKACGIAATDFTSAIPPSCADDNNYPEKNIDAFIVEKQDEIAAPFTTARLANSRRRSSSSFSSEPSIVTAKNSFAPSESSSGLKTPHSMSRSISALSAQLANIDVPLLASQSIETAYGISPGTPQASTQTLYSVFVEVYQHLSEYSSLVQSAFNRSTNDAAINYLEPATAVIRSVRHLLYFADGRFTKSMQNTDLTACLGKHMSVVIDRTRKIGFHAKHLTEEECMGFRNTIAVQTLLDNVDELQSELHVFVNVAKILSDLDLILTRRTELLQALKIVGPSYSVVTCLFDQGREMAQLVSAAEKQRIIRRILSLTAFASDFCIIIDPLIPRIVIPEDLTTEYPHLNININKIIVPQYEFTQSFTQVAQYEQDLRTALDLDISNWEIVEIHITEKYFSLLFLLIRQLVSLAAAENHDQSKIPFNALWLQLDTSLNVSLSGPKKLPARQSMSLPVSSSTKWGNINRSSSPEMQYSSSPTYLSLQQDHALLMSSYLNLARTYSDASTVSRRRYHNEATRQSSDNDIPAAMNENLRTVSPPSAVTLSINQAVFRSANELTGLINDVSKNLIDFISANAVHGKPVGNTLDRVVQMALSVVTAANQVEEELASLEGSSLDTKTQILVDEALQSHSRAISAFELAIKNMTSFFAPDDATQQVSLAAADVNNTCLALEMAMHSAMEQQNGEALAAMNPEDWDPLEPPPTPPQSPIFPEIIEDTTEQFDEKFVDDLLETEMKDFEEAPEIVIRRGVDNEQSVKGGTLQKLVEKLTYHKLPPTDYTAAFLLTYRSFTTADCLLRLLIDRYRMVAVPEFLTEIQRKYYISKKIIPVRLRIFNVIKMWIKNNFEDFEREPALLDMLLDFLPIIKEDFHKGAMDFEKLLSKKKRGDVNAIVLHHRCPPPPTILPRTLNTINIVEIDPLEMARQLTIIQSRIFFSIEPSECMNQSWNRKQYHHRSPNIRRMIQLSNHIVQWVATEIIGMQSLKCRAHVMKHFIGIAEKLKLLNNFDGLKSVLCGLQASGIRRLSKTWEALPAKQRALFHELSALMSEEKSFKNYRQFLHSIDPPCIPFLGVYLTDLTMIDTGNPDRIKGNPNLINFQKHYLEAQVIQELRRYQCTTYNLTEIARLTHWINSYNIKDPQEVYDESLILEPKISATTTVSNNIASMFDSSLIASASNSIGNLARRTSFVSKKPSFLVRLGNGVGSKET